MFLDAFICAFICASVNDEVRFSNQNRVLTDLPTHYGGVERRCPRH